MASMAKACAMAANFSHGAFARLFRLNGRIAARASGRRHDRHLVAGRWRRDLDAGIHVAGRMNHAAGLIQLLAQTLPALLSGLRIGLRRVLICAPAWWL